MQSFHRPQLGTQRIGEGLINVHPTANYKATKEHILEQASLKRDAHFYDKGKHDKPAPMEVDALLAKVSALNNARGVGDEAGGKEPHGHDLMKEDLIDRKRKLGQIIRRLLWTKSKGS